MTNPKRPEDWNPIEETLVKILGDTHLSDVLSKQAEQTRNISIDKLISEGKGINN